MERLIDGGMNEWMNEGTIYRDKKIDAKLYYIEASKSKMMMKTTMMVVMVEIVGGW